MSTTNSDETRVSENKLTPQAYWDVVEVAYHMTKDEGFRLGDFVRQAYTDFTEKGGFEAIGDIGLETEDRPPSKVEAITSEALITAISVSEVLGCRLTYSEHNDWIGEQGYEGESVSEYGFRRFVDSLDALTVDEMRFCKACIQVAQPYVDEAVMSDDLLNERGRITNIISARQIDTRLLVLLDRAEISAKKVKEA